MGRTTYAYSSEVAPGALMPISSASSSISHPHSFVESRAGAGASSASSHGPEFSPAIYRQYLRPGAGSSLNEYDRLSPVGTFKTTPSSPQRSHHCWYSCYSIFAPADLKTPPTLPFVKSHSRTYSDGQESTAESFNTARSDYSGNSALNSPDLDNDSTHQALKQQQRLLTRSSIMSGSSGIGMGLTGIDSSPEPEDLFSPTTNESDDRDMTLSSSSSGVGFNHTQSPEVDLPVAPQLQHETYTAYALPASTTAPAANSSILDRSAIQQKASYLQAQSQISSSESSIAHKSSTTSTIIPSIAAELPSGKSSVLSSHYPLAEEDYSQQSFLKHTRTTSSPLLSSMPSLLGRESNDAYSDATSGEAMTTTAALGITRATQVSSPNSATGVPSSPIRSGRLSTSSPQSSPLIIASSLRGTEAISHTEPPTAKYRSLIPRDVESPVHKPDTQSLGAPFTAIVNEHTPFIPEILKHIPQFQAALQPRHLLLNLNLNPRLSNVVFLWSPRQIQLNYKIHTSVLLRNCHVVVLVEAVVAVIVTATLLLDVIVLVMILEHPAVRSMFLNSFHLLLHQQVMYH